MLISINRNIIDTLSKTELDIVHFINDNEDKFSELSIGDIARKTFSSISTVSRAIRKCGINGFQELRYRAINNVQKKDVRYMTDIINRSLIDAQETIDRISVTELLETVRLIKECNKIYVFARGLSEYVAEEFALKLQLLGNDVAFYHDPNIMRICSEKMKKGDLLIVFSLNGKTAELVESSQNAFFRGIPIVLCCCDENTPMSEFAHCKLTGYQQSDHSIKDYEVASRLSLQIISRLITDYLVVYRQNI